MSCIFARLLNIQFHMSKTLAKTQVSLRFMLKCLKTSRNSLQNVYMNSKSLQFLNNIKDFVEMFEFLVFSLAFLTHEIEYSKD